MKKFKKLLAITAGLLMGVILITGNPVSAANVTVSSELSDSLVKAYTDEMKIKNYYEAVIDKFGEEVPFINIIKAEENHASAVERQLKLYNIDVPEVTTMISEVPETFEEAISLSIQVEKDDIAFYEEELQKNFPSNVKRVYTNLLKGSKSHLSAFESGGENCINPDGANPQRKNQQANQANRVNNGYRANGKGQKVAQGNNRLANGQGANGTGRELNLNECDNFENRIPQRQNKAQGNNRPSNGQGLNRKNMSK